MRRAILDQKISDPLSNFVEKHTLWKPNFLSNSTRSVVGDSNTSPDINTRKRTEKTPKYDNEKIEHLHGDHTSRHGSSSIRNVPSRYPAKSLCESFFGTYFFRNDFHKIDCYRERFWAKIISSIVTWECELNQLFIQFSEKLIVSANMATGHLELSI